MNPIAVVAHVLVAVGLLWRIGQAIEYRLRGGRS